MDEFEIRRAAAEAGVDPRSLKKHLAGGRVRGVAGERVARAAERLRANARSSNPPPSQHP
jgi:hypothetical protein